jgi:hypothetical protein
MSLHNDPKQKLIEFFLILSTAIVLAKVICEEWKSLFGG